MPTFEELVSNKEIEFYSRGRKLHSTVINFGTYNWELVKHIIGQAGNSIVMKGSGLEEHLYDAQNLYELANFAVQLYFTGSKKYRSGWGIHVDVDIDNFDAHYKQPSEEKITNGLGQVVCDAATWANDIPYFEKSWNFALCEAIGGAVGYPGYEWPKDDKAFRRERAIHAEHFMIGTRDQIQRYRKYALKHLNNAIAISDEFKKDPDSIFQDPYRVMSLEITLKQARRIAENVLNFSIDYDTS